MFTKENAFIGAEEPESVLSLAPIEGRIATLDRELQDAYTRIEGLTRRVSDLERVTERLANPPSMFVRKWLSLFTKEHRKGAFVSAVSVIKKYKINPK